MNDSGRTHIERAEDSDRETLENLFQFYLYDISEFISLVPTSSGKFRFDAQKLNKYWEDTECSPYLIKYEGSVAGFLLARRYPSDKSVSDIEQFFIMRSYRRLGVGKRALQQCLARHPGTWQVRVLLENKPAYMFWERAISKITNRNFMVAEEMDEGLLMHFFRFEYAGS